jgi:hypothetical protein
MLKTNLKCSVTLTVEVRVESVEENDIIYQFCLVFCKIFLKKIQH